MKFASNQKKKLFSQDLLFGKACVILVVLLNLQQKQKKSLFRVVTF